MKPVRRIIKADEVQVERHNVPPILREEDRIDAERERIREELRVEMEKELAEARRRLGPKNISKDEAVEAARKAGRVEGERVALEAYSKRFAEALSVLGTLREEVEAMPARMARETEEDLIRLAVSLAEKILRREIQGDLAPVKMAVHDALRMLPNRKAVTLCVSEPDLVRFQDLQESLRDEISGIEELHLQVSKSLKLGDCIVLSDSGAIDGTLKRQLERLEESFKGNDGTPDAAD